jgi:uncharacterized protein YndB with AHSA1/START domain
MHCEALLAHPLTMVFGCLAAPAGLGDWLPEVTRIGPDAALAAGIGATFGLRLLRGGADVAATGELIAYQPPRSVAYRLVAGPRTHVIRLTCTSSGDATLVQIYQADHMAPLAVDLAALGQAMTAGAAAKRPIKTPTTIQTAT